MSSAPSILIVKPSSLGDVVHTLPALALLRRHWPESTIRWVVNPEWAPLLEGNPALDEVIVFPRGQFRGLSGLTRILPWARSMRPFRSDLVLDFQGLLRSALISRLCRGGEILGLSDSREGSSFFYDRIADVSNQRHAVDRYLQLLTLLDIRGPVEWPLPAGKPVPGIEPGFVLLHPFSRGKGKSLTVTEVSEFCRALAPIPVLIAGRSEEAVPPAPNLRNLLNQTSLTELIWLIRQAAFVVSVDSGPMHIAAALTPNLLSLHTWSDPAKVGPYRPEAWIWKNRELFQQGPAAGSAPSSPPSSPRPAQNCTELAHFVAELLPQLPPVQHRA